MLDLRLTKEEWRQYMARLLGSHEAKINVELWDRNRNHRATVKWLPEQGMDGQVNIDVTGTTGRDATITIADPEDKIHADSNQLQLDRLLRIEHWVKVPEFERGNKWVVAPLFTGPISKADNLGNHMIAIQAQGKELWARGGVKVSRTWPKGARVTDVIRQIMVQVVGEEHFWLDIPDMKHRLPEPFDLSPKDASAWKACRYLAQTIDCDLFYDGASRCKLRPSDTAAVFVFTGGQDGCIMSLPQTSTLIGGNDASDLSGLHNEIYVNWNMPPRKPGGPPPAEPGHWVAPVGSRFHPASMGNPGHPLYLTKTITNTHIGKKTTADRLARTWGRRGLQAAEEFAVDSAIIPFLDDYDLCRYYTKLTGGGQFEFTKATIPLLFSASNPMAVGFVDQRSFAPQGLAA
jgi:hypothetical protein